MGGDDKFASLVDKSHRYFVEFKTIFDSDVEELPNSTVHHRIWLLFKGKGVRCGECYTTLKNQDFLTKHTNAYHPETEEEADASTYMSPYRFFKVDEKFVCPLGCATTTPSGKIIRKHLVNEHNEADLNKWGYSRDLLYREYLLLLEKADLEDEGGQDSTLIG